MSDARSPSAAEVAAMQRALHLARVSGVDRGPNPAVGCVLLTPGGQTLAEGWHKGPGTAHAEAMALAIAGDRSRGATAVVTLEPCAHHGRTPPCADALVAAGVARVVFAQTDPNRAAAGGADVLRRAGIDVVGGVCAPQARACNPLWSLAAEMQRPVVLWKVAASLDGRIAAADGTSKWITSDASREQVHVLRAHVDAVVTSTGTALADAASLTARPGGQLADKQPVRGVVGLRPLPEEHPLADGLVLRTRDPGEALRLLWQRDVRHVMLESGPHLAGAFLAAGLVDQIVWFTAPMVLGAGARAAVSAGPATLADALRWEVRAVASVGPDTRTDLARPGVPAMGHDGRVQPDPVA